MTSADLKTPALLTHVEVAHLLGSDRTRQRWENEGLLPRPRWAHAFGRALGLYPGVILARLAAGRDGKELESALEDMVARSVELLGSSLFDEAVACLEPLVAQKTALGLSTDLLVALSDTGVLARLLQASADIAFAETKSGMSFHSRVGRYVGKTGASVMIESGGDQVAIGGSFVLGPITVGETVAIENVRLGSRQVDYVMPALAVMTGTAAVATSPIDDDDLEIAFAGLNGRRPIAVPLVATGNDVNDDAGDIRRVRGRFTIQIPVEIYQDANPMARA